MKRMDTYLGMLHVLTVPIPARIFPQIRADRGIHLPKRVPKEGIWNKKCRNYDPVHSPVTFIRLLKFQTLALSIQCKTV